MEASARPCDRGSEADARRGEGARPAKPGNLASQKVVLANGGRLVGRFFEDAAYGGAESLRYRIDL